MLKSKAKAIACTHENCSSNKDIIQEIYRRRMKQIVYVSNTIFHFPLRYQKTRITRISELKIFIQTFVNLVIKKLKRSKNRQKKSNETEENGRGRRNSLLQH